MRIGLTGYATAGKDVVADVLVAEYGFVKINMSDALDYYLCILDPILNTSGERYSEYRARVDYVTAKQNPEVRRLLQKLGTDVGRDIDPNIWVNVLNRNAVLHENVVTTGIRYPEEVVHGMTVIAVHRPGVGPLNDHSSENLQPIFDLAEVTIHNNSTIEILQDMVRSVFNKMGLKAS